MASAHSGFGTGGLDRAQANHDTPERDEYDEAWDKHFKHQVEGRKANFTHGAVSHKEDAVSRITDTYDEHGLPPF